MRYKVYYESGIYSLCVKRFLYESEIHWSKLYNQKQFLRIELLLFTMNLLKCKKRFIISLFYVNWHPPISVWKLQKHWKWKQINIILGSKYTSIMRGNQFFKISCQMILKNQKLYFLIHWIVENNQLLSVKLFEALQ